MLVTLMEAWERKHYRFDPPDPVQNESAALVPAKKLDLPTRAISGPGCIAAR